jgi:glycosyltransferase involved in cell wall biosynthesis
MKTAEVTVVIPTYNHGRYIVDAVESALAQTHRPLEIVVIDDGSTDDTAERLAPYRGQIECIWQENQGLSAARNAGIRRARGEWIAFLDADDVWAPEKTESQLRAAAAIPDAMLIGAAGRGDRQFDSAPLRPQVHRCGVRDFLTTTPFGPSSALMRRSVFERVGLFDEELSPVADRDMWLRVAAVYPVIWIDWPCWWYRESPEQMSRDPHLMFESLRRLLEKFFDREPSYAHLRRLGYAFLYLDGAWCHYQFGRRKDALQLLLRSAWSRPQGIPNRAPLLRLKLLARFLRGRYSPS